jgi:DNA recombination protein RmuC
MGSSVYFVIGLLAGGVLGLVVGWLVGRKSTPDNRLETELRQQLAQREAELSNARTELLRAQTACASAEAARGAAQTLLSQQREAHERALQETRAAQEKAVADLREAFRALSAEALKQNAPEFLRLAEQNFGKFQATAQGELARREEAIKTLVEPLKQQLELYQKQLQRAESAQAATLGEVRKQLDTLAQQSHTLARETQQFRIVLKSNQARGRWGEETLRRVVEAAGMSAHCDFSEQTQAGDSKPDLLVHLPGDRFIIVDAKVPDLDFLADLDSLDSDNRAESLAQHAAKLKATIKALADRDYPGQFPNALDHVVLFLPAESLFSAALEGDRDLIIWAAERRILLATPASLIALLRSVSVSWQQHAQTENAQKIAEGARELYARVLAFSKHFQDMGAGLERANAAFNAAAASFQTRVRPAGERLADLGGGIPGKPLPDLQPLQGSLRLMPAPDVIDKAESFEV